MRTISLKWIGYIALVISALAGFTVALVMMHTPYIRASVSFKSTVCRVHKTGLTVAEMEGKNMTRAFAEVKYPTKDSALIVSEAYDTLNGEYSLKNKSKFLSQYKEGNLYSCFYNPSNYSHVTMELKNRVLIITFLALVLTIIIAIPVAVSIYTFFCQSFNEADDDKPQFRIQEYTLYNTETDEDQPFNSIDLR